jgi:hypothetical protein
MTNRAGPGQFTIAMEIICARRTLTFAVTIHCVDDEIVD